MSLSCGCVTTELFFPQHFFILQCLLVEVQLKYHVDIIDLLFVFFLPLFFFPDKSNAQDLAPLLTGAQPSSAAWRGVSAGMAPPAILLGSPKTGICFWLALEML